MKNLFLRCGVFFLYMISAAILIISLAAVAYGTWIIFGKWYIQLNHPIGGDYYTGLTYASQLMKHLPLPPQGWLSFWNSGVPLIGGYQWFMFYLLTPVTYFFDVVTGLNYFSVISIIIFFVASHLLYFQISKNHLIALTLSGIGLTSHAPYYQLTSAGLITGSSMQLYLPLSLFFLLRFLEYPLRIRLLLLSAGINGIALLHHPVMSLLFVTLPTLVIFLAHIVFRTSKREKWWASFFLFLLFTVLIGSMGIFPFLSQMSFQEIASSCNNPQCWGIYPFHIERWLGWLPVVVFSLSLIAIILIKIIAAYFNKKISLKPLIPLLCGTLIVSAYPIAAYTHLINTLSNSIFPRRMFWAVLVLFLVVTAENFKILSKFNKWTGWLLSMLFFLVIFVLLPVKLQSNNSLQLHYNFAEEAPNAVPNYIHTVILPQFEDAEMRQDYLKGNQIPQNFNTRIDIHNASVIQWWNLASNIGVTRGYTSGFNKDNFVWTYYFQDALKKDEQKNIPNTIILNRAKFLFDAFGVGYTSHTDYHSTIVGNKELYSEGNHIFDTLNTEISSPIIQTTNSSPILFVGDDQGYSTFIRLLSNLNLNSKFLIPVKGPHNLTQLSESDLKKFNVLFLYRFKGNLDLLDTFIRNGGKVFVELGSIAKIPKNLGNALSDIKLNESNPVNWQLLLNESSSESMDVEIEAFAPLRYKNSTWKVVSIFLDQIPQNGQVLLSHDKEALLFNYEYGNGSIYVSGLNLPFHIIEYENTSEGNLMRNIIRKLVTSQKQPEQPLVTRPTPEEVTIDLTGYNNIYFKENYHLGWKAETDFEELQIYKAGMNFMYIPIPQHQTGTVRLTFKGTFFSWTLWYLTIVSLILLTGILVFPALSIKIYGKIFHPLILIWQNVSKRLKSDEHEMY